MKVVYGPGTFINESAGQIADAFTRTKNQKSVEANQAGKAAYKLARSKGYSVARAKQFESEARSLVFNEFVRDAVRLGLQYKLTGIPRINEPELRRDARLREHEPVQAQGALRLPVPDVRLGADPGAAAAGPERRAAHAGDLADPRRGRG